MFDRSRRPNCSGTVAAGAVFLVLAGILSAPALASTTTRFLCSEVTEATLHVSVAALAADVVSHNIPVAPRNADTAGVEIEKAATTSLLAPRAEAAIREAFRNNDEAAVESSKTAFSRAVLTPPMVGTDSKIEHQNDADNRARPDSGMNTRLPGVSNDAMLLYKKKMYRRDI